MGNLRIANRYAEAIMLSAEELNVLKNVNDNFTVLRRVVGDSREFQRFLKSPIIRNEKKQQVFDAVFGKTLHPLTLKFLSLLVDKNRENILPDIIESFFRLQDEKLGLVNVQVNSATELSAQQTTQLQQRFEAFSRKKVRIDASINSKLIGGFIARIGDTMFDGSVKRQLELLRKKYIEEISAV